MSSFPMVDNDKKEENDNNVDILEEANTSNKSENILDKLNNYLISLSKIKVKEKVIFFRLLSTMLNA